MTCGHLGVFLRPAFWDDARCARARAAMDLASGAPAEIFLDEYVVDEDVRRTFDVDVDTATILEVEETLESVRHELSAFFGCSLTRTEGPGFLRYPTGGFYRAHRDRPDHDDAETDLPRRVSVVLFLTTAGAHSDAHCEGGALRLYAPQDPVTAWLDIQPVAGTLVAFPSTLLHEVLPVTDGVRDAIVDWFY